MRHIVVTLLIASCCAFGQRGGGGFRGGAGPRGGYGHGHYSGAVAVPFPVYVGGYYSGYAAPGYGYGYGYDPSTSGYPPPGYYGDPGNPGYGPGYPPPGYTDPSQQSPVVIVNPGYQPQNVNPVVRDYSNTPLPQPGMTKYQNESHPYSNQPAATDEQPTIYLIAMKDHTIFPTVAYWVEGDTLNYVTTEGARNRASLALVDRDFSKQLNDERHVEFKLPAPK